MRVSLLEPKVERWDMGQWNMEAGGLGGHGMELNGEIPGQLSSLLGTYCSSADRIASSLGQTDKGLFPAYMVTLGYPGVLSTALLPGFSAHS